MAEVIAWLIDERVAQTPPYDHPYNDVSQEVLDLFRDCGRRCGFPKVSPSHQASNHQKSEDEANHIGKRVVSQSQLETEQINAEQIWPDIGEGQIGLHLLTCVCGLLRGAAFGASQICHMRDLGKTTRTPHIRGRDDIKDDPMQSRNKMFDDISQLMTNAMGMAHGARTEAENAMKSMMDRWLADRDFVTREEFDAVRAMAQKAREENEALKARIDSLEAK